MTAIQNYRTQDRRPIIMTDLDGCLCDSLPGIIERANERFGKALTLEDITTYDLHKLYGVSEKRWLDWWNDVEMQNAIYAEAPAIEGAQSLVYFPHKIYLLTARERTYHDITRGWLNTNGFGSITRSRHLGHQSKADYLTFDAITPDWCIEDSPKAALELAERFRVLLMDASYNRDVTHPNIVRVCGWADALRVLEGEA